MPDAVIEAVFAGGPKDITDKARQLDFVDLPRSR